MINLHTCFHLKAFIFPAAALVHKELCHEKHPACEFGRPRERFLELESEASERQRGAGSRFQMAPANVLEGCGDVSAAAAPASAALSFTQRVYYSGIICERPGILRPPVSASVSL